MTLPPFKYIPFYFYIGKTRDSNVDIHLPRDDLPWYLQETIKDTKFSPIFQRFLVGVSQDFVSRLMNGRDESVLNLSQFLRNGSHVGPHAWDDSYDSHGGMEHMSFASMRGSNEKVQNDFNSIPQLQKEKSQVPHLNSYNLLQIVNKCLEVILQKKCVQRKEYKKINVWMLGGNSKLSYFPKRILLDVGDRWRTKIQQKAIQNINKILFIQGADEETNIPFFNRVELPIDPTTLVIMSGDRFSQRGYVFPCDTFVLDKIPQDKLEMLADDLSTIIIQPSILLASASGASPRKVMKTDKKLRSGSTERESCGRDPHQTELEQHFEGRYASLENAKSFTFQQRLQSLLNFVNEEDNCANLKELLYTKDHVCELFFKGEAEKFTSSEKNLFEMEGKANDRLSNETQRSSEVIENVDRASHLEIVHIGRKSFLMIPSESTEATYIIQSYSPFIAQDVKADIMHEYGMECVDICEGLGGGTLEIALWNELLKWSQNVDSLPEKKTIEAFAEAILIIPNLMIKYSETLTHSNEIVHEMKNSFVEETCESLGFNFEKGALTPNTHHTLVENITHKRELYRLVLETAVVALRGVRLKI